MKNLIVFFLALLSLSSSAQLPSKNPAIVYRNFVATAEVTVLYKQTTLTTNFAVRREGVPIDYPTERGEFMIGFTKEVTVEDQIIKPDTFIAGFYFGDEGLVMTLELDQPAYENEPFGEIAYKIPLRALDEETTCTLGENFAVIPYDPNMYSCQYIVSFGQRNFGFMVIRDEGEELWQKIEADLSKAKSSETEKWLMASTYAIESGQRGEKALKWVQKTEGSIPDWKFNWYLAQLHKQLGNTDVALNYATATSQLYKKAGFQKGDPFYDELNQFIESVQ